MDQKELLHNIDKKIKIMCLNVKNKKVTYLIGIESFFDEEKIKSFIKTMKQKLGTNYSKREEESDKNPENKTIYHGFNGMHSDIIYNYLIETCQIDKKYLSK